MLFNLLVGYDENSWNDGSYNFSRSRVLKSFTVDEIRERYKDLNEKAIEELKSLPSLFVTENESVDSKLGYITDVRLRHDDVVVSFEFDNNLPSIPSGAVKQLSVDFDIRGYELTHTHWAVKDEPLFDILIKRGFLTKDQLNQSQEARAAQTTQPTNLPAATPSNFNKSQVFIVHGHDDLAKFEMYDFLKSLELEPIILHLYASSGRTIIEKIEHYSNVGFGVVLYTPCDVGQKNGSLNSNYRARQNVVFEHGYLIGKLGRSRVSAMVKGSLELPNDISGVVYVSMDEAGDWKQALIRELNAAGYEVNT